MRTLRLTVASVAGIALLAAVGPAATAQHDPVVVDGPEVARVFHRDTTCMDHDQLDVGGDEDGWDWFRGWTTTCQDSLSDPRVSGLRTTVYNDDCFGEWEDPCVSWGTEEIVGPDGRWVGSFRGTLVGEQHTFLRLLHGTGAYDGLTFLWHGSGSLEEPTGTGLIYEGVPAPMPALAEIEVPTLASAMPPTEPMVDPATLPTITVDREDPAPPAGIGAAFMQPNGVFTPTHYVLGTDGSAYSLSPFWGHGLGLWEPGADGDISMSLLFGDADPSALSEVRGSTVVDVSASYDAVTDSLLLEWAANGRGGEDSAVSTTRGEAVALRRHLSQMPAVAEVETPPDPGWRPQLATGAFDDGRGFVSFTNEGEEQMLVHADGTGIGLNPWIGDWVGLSTVVDDYSIGSSWWGPASSMDQGLVIQTPVVEDASSVVATYGTTEDGWWGSNVDHRLEHAPIAADASLPAEAGPEAWPAASSLWLEEGADGLGAYLQLHADGTAMRLDLDGLRAPAPGPAYLTPLSDIAVSVGEWYPTEDGGFHLTMRYQAPDPEGAGQLVDDMTYVAEGRTSADGEQLDYRFRLERAGLIGDPVVETGSGTAARFHLGDQELP